MRSSAFVAAVLALAAAAVAWRLGLATGDPRAVGLLGGALLGGALALASAGWQQRMLLTRPALAVHTVAGTMLVKLVALAAVAVTLAWVPAAAERADLVTGMLSFVGAVVVVGAFGTRDALRTVRRQAGARDRTLELTPKPLAGAPDSPTAR